MLVNCECDIYLYRECIGPVPSGRVAQRAGGPISDAYAYDLRLFSKLKDQLCGRRFSSNEELTGALLWPSKISPKKSGKCVLIIGLLVCKNVKAVRENTSKKCDRNIFDSYF